MEVQPSTLSVHELQKAFGEDHLLPTQDFFKEIEGFFNLGSDRKLLSAQEQESLQLELDDVLAHYSRSKLPLIADVFGERLRSVNATETLDILQSSETDAYSLSESDRRFFAFYGILPPHQLKTITDRSLLLIERHLDVLAKRSLNSSLAYLFSRDILDLALNPEIISRVSSLLGDNITFLGSSGPMYKAPRSKDATPWHNASARAFGGGYAESNFDLVTCWVALSNSSRAHGCMKMLPRSFTFNSLKQDIFKWDGQPISTTEGLIHFLKSLDYEVDMQTVEKMLCRRKTFSRVEGLSFVEGSSRTKRYNPFHNSIDLLMALGTANLASITPFNMIAMEAKRGDMYSFISQNTHGSFNNTSNQWRKAVALRYVKTGAANPNIADESFELLNRYVQSFPLATSVLDRLGASVETYRSASPRICIKGFVPPTQKSFYIDSVRLREALENLSVFSGQ